MRDISLTRIGIPCPPITNSKASDRSVIVRSIPSVIGIQAYRISWPLRLEMRRR
jgi:hypothetical protein